MLVGFFLASLSLLACEPSLTKPALYAVTPEWVDNDQEHIITLIGDGFLPKIQVGNGGVDINRQFLVCLVDPVTQQKLAELPVVTKNDYSTLTATIPEGLEPGAYDIMVDTPTGMSDVLSGAFQITETAASQIIATSESSQYTTGTTVQIFLQVKDTDNQPLGEDFPVTISVASDDGALVFKETLPDQVYRGDGNGIMGVLDNGEGLIEIITDESGRYELDISVPEDIAYFANEDLKTQYTLLFQDGEVADVQLWLDREEATAGENVGLRVTLLGSNDEPVTHPTSLTFLVTELCSNEQGFFQGTITIPADNTDRIFTVQPQVMTNTTVCRDGGFSVELLKDKPSGPLEIAAISDPLAITPSAPRSLEVETLTVDLVAGDEAKMLISAQDRFGNSITNYSQPLSFLSTIADQEDFVGSVCTDWNIGKTLCEVALTRANPAVQVSILSDDGLSGKSASMQVEAGPLALMLLSTETSPTIAGITRSFQLGLQDAYGNAADRPKDGVSFHSTEGPIGCVETAAASGLLDFLCVFTQARTDARLEAHASGLSTSSVPFTVVNGPLHEITVSSPGNLVVGDPFSVSLAGMDTYGNPYIEIGSGSNVVELYDESGDLEELATLGVDGIAVVTALTLTTAWDDNSIGVYQGGLWLGQSLTFDVAAGELDGFSVSSPSSWVEVDEVLDVTVVAVDAYSNTFTAFDETRYSAGVLWSDQGSGADVSLSGFIDGVAELAFAPDEATLADLLRVEMGSLVGQGSTFDVVQLDCEDPPAALVEVDEATEAVLCLTDGETETVEVSAASSSAGSDTLSAWHFFDGRSWERSDNDTTSGRWYQEGAIDVQALVVDASACGNIADTTVYVARDDNKPAGPVSVTAVDSTISANTSSSTGSSTGSTTVTVFAVDCEGSPASGSLFVRTDVGLLSAGASVLTATGSGLSVSLDSLGEASFKWDAGVQRYGEIDGSLYVGRYIGSARGSLVLPITDDAQLPQVVSVSPAGTFSSVHDTIVVHFSDAVDSSTVSDSTVTILDPDSMPVSVLDYDISGEQVSIALGQDIDPADGEWTLQLDRNISDTNGNGLDGAMTGTVSGFELGIGGVTDTAPDVTSCTAALSMFRPDGDDGAAEESDTVELSFTAGGAPAWWQVSILDSSNEAVALYTIPEGASAAGSMLWHGVGGDGIVLPNGTYTFAISALDGSWNAGDECAIEVIVANYME
jgi:hypothetical protein